VRVGIPATAFDGATEIIPNPKDAITVKATRLKNVVFDTTFLSIFTFLYLVEVKKTLVRIF
jgi:hypothetical protein